MLSTAKIAIVDATYKDPAYYGLAATWLRYELAQRKIDPVDPRDADYLLVSVTSPKSYRDVKRVRKTCWNGKAKIVIGGGGAFAPAVFDPLIDAAVVGEGYEFLMTLLCEGYDAAVARPEVWIPGDTRGVVPNEVFPWHIPPLLYPDGLCRVFGSRGCHNKCLFCQTGNSQSYRSNPDPERVKRQLDLLKREGRKFAVVTNDGADVPFIDGQQEAVSATYKKLKVLQDAGRMTRKYYRSVRIGVEGVSERLRAAVGKPIRNADLTDMTVQAIKDGVQVRWFFIAGLPGEQREDWRELEALLDSTRRVEKSMVMVSFTGFVPEPSAPLCVLPIVDEYLPWYNDAVTRYFRGPGFTGRLHFLGPGFYRTRLREAMEAMCSKEPQLRKGWFDKDNPNWRVQFPLSPDKLRHRARAYLRRLQPRG